MITKRIIPCLDCDLGIPGGRVVKGVQFKDIQYAGDPVNLAERYYEDGADEISFLDITASVEKRETMVDVIKRVSEKVFVPLSVGGGISKVEDFKKMLEAGADKCIMATAAIKNPELISKASERFGSQCVVISLDVKRNISEGLRKPRGEVLQGGSALGYECYIYGGRTPTGINAIEFAKKVKELGAGEILLNSIDADGTKKGYDIELTKRISDKVSIPVIASGGCGKPEDILEVLEKTKATAALAASIFHFEEYSIKKVKQFLRERGIEVRI